MEGSADLGFGGLEASQLVIGVHGIGDGDHRLVAHGREVGGHPVDRTQHHDRVVARQAIHVDAGEDVAELRPGFPIVEVMRDLFPRLQSEHTFDSVMVVRQKPRLCSAGLPQRIGAVRRYLG